MPSFSQMINAVKRSKHFVQDYSLNLPFSIIKSQNNHVSAAVSNYCLMFDYENRNYFDELSILHNMAIAINEFCDKNEIKNDDLAKNAMSCFLSRLWLHVEFLKDENRFQNSKNIALASDAAKA